MDMFSIESSIKKFESSIHNVDKIREIVNTRFFIAGGSVFSDITGTEYEDIDVFFYTETDFDLAVLSLDKHNINMLLNTDNAITFKYDNSTVQFIRHAFGTPQEIFDGFDLNCSKVCVTSNKETIKNKTFDTSVSIDFKNFKSSTVSRYFKYTEKKKALDKNYAALKSMISYLIENRSKQLPMSYNTESSTCAYKLKELTHSLSNKNERIKRLLYDEVSLLPLADAIGIYDLLPRYDVDNDKYNMSVLLDNVSKIRFDNTPYTPTDKERLLMLKYAEYFI